MKSIQKAKYLELLSVLGIGGAHPGGINLTTEIFKHERINDTSHVLDVGCGTGQTAAYLTQNFGANVTAIDVNRTMLEKAKYRMAINNLHVHFIEGSIEQTALADQSFDFILSESVLSFVNKPRALSEIYRLLKMDGRFIAIEQTMNAQLADEDAKEISVIAQKTAQKSRITAIIQGNRLPSSIEDIQLLRFKKFNLLFYHMQRLSSILCEKLWHYSDIHDNI